MNGRFAPKAVGQERPLGWESMKDG
jgi:hypothetical protein